MGVYRAAKNVDCRLSTWGDCDKNGLQIRTIMRESKNDGSTCKGKELTRNCQGCREGQECVPYTKCASAMVLGEKIEEADFADKIPLLESLSNLFCQDKSG